MDWPLDATARRLDEKISSDGDQLPREILRLDDSTAGIIVEIDGVDYMLTMTRIPNQRPRPH